MIPYGKHRIDQKDIDSVVRALKSKFLTQGPLVKKFENSLKSITKAKYALAVNSATSALHISCLALGIDNKKIVWTVPNTFVSTANAALFCGAKIDFVDIDSDTLNICIKSLSEKLILSKEKNLKPDLLITVHLGGNPTESKEIRRLSKMYNFKIIEDASHSFGAKYYKKNVGCSLWSDITVFSFHPVKMITTGEGGAALTNNKNIYDKLILYGNNGVTKDKKKFIFKNNQPNYYEQQVLGFNYRLTEIQAALGISQLKKINKYVKERNLLANYYKKKLIHPNILFQKIVKNFVCSYHLLIIKIKGKKNKLLRNKIITYLLNKNIYAGIHYYPVHLHPYYKKIGFSERVYPNSEEHSRNSISLPIYSGLKIKNLDLIIKYILKIMNDK
jgi:UDP-4-amino-4,6-dideoxy-N-acetyl-beta-L-altrosamine transaminase